LAFVADFGTQNFHLKTKFDMKNKTSINHENGNDANRLLAAVNFCTMSHDELLKILDLCDATEVLSKTEMVQKIKGEECIEKRWEWYDTLVVTPKEIKFSTSPYPSQTIMTAEKYLKMKAIFNGC
jgi:hypothetical protein